MSPILSFSLAAVLSASAAADNPHRYALTGTLTAAPAHSVDARFGVQASARVFQPIAPTPGRFALKSTEGTVACDAATDIFRNGFE